MSFGLFGVKPRLFRTSLNWFRFKAVSALMFPRRADGTVGGGGGAMIPVVSSQTPDNYFPAFPVLFQHFRNLRLRRNDELARELRGREGGYLSAQN